MQRRFFLSSVTGILATLLFAVGGCTRDSSRDAHPSRTSVPSQSAAVLQEIPIVYPVTVDALQEIGRGADEALRGSGWRVRPFSAEGDAAKFGPVFEAALARRAPVVITVGTQITNTALGPKYTASRPPLVAAAIFDPARLEGIDPLRRPQMAIVSDQPSNAGARLVETIRRLAPGVHTVGLLSNRGEVNSVASADAVSRAAISAGLRVERAFLSSPADLAPATQSLLLRGVDAIVIPHDKIAVAQAATVAQLGLNHTPGRVPVFSLDNGTVENDGVLACVSADYTAIGRYVGRLALKAVSGSALRDEAVLFPSESIVAVNRHSAERLGLTLPADLGASVRVVE